MAISLASLRTASALSPPRILMHGVAERVNDFETVAFGL